MFKAGDEYRVWWSTNNENMARILDINPYTGRYKEMFTHVLKLEAPRTNRGWLELAVKLT